MISSSDIEFHNKIKLYQNVLKNGSSDLTEFLNDISAIIHNNENDGKHKIDEKILNKIYLVKDLEKAQSKYDRLRLSVNCTFDSIKAECQDVYDKDHYLILNFDKNKSYRIRQHTLPEMKILMENFTDMCSAVDTFYNCLNDIEEYLEVLDDLDTNCWVIDPKIATTKDNYRRIVINENISAMITVDVECAKKPPCIKLLGLSKVTDPLMEQIRENMIEWDIDGPFITNMLTLFGVDQFPLKDDLTANSENDIGLSNTECSICLTDRDDIEGQLPSIMCEKCKQNYHKVCLFQWLTMTANVIHGLNTVHGQCPSCSSPISCPSVT
ncbi:E3 ubiquitin-protein ligase FANCL-like [Arctopsyche grandis]|uniref:E3 ubiquitin-protein ligase FANCL-like n=1 Tax=Arctopsyche grandis TaxID=121162 RepID=UPI00406D831E